MMGREAGRRGKYPGEMGRYEGEGDGPDGRKRKGEGDVATQAGKGHQPSGYEPGLGLHFHATGFFLRSSGATLRFI